MSTRPSGRRAVMALCGDAEIRLRIRDVELVVAGDADHRLLDAAGMDPRAGAGGLGGRTRHQGHAVRLGLRQRLREQDLRARLGHLDGGIQAHLVHALSIGHGPRICRGTPSTSEQIS